MARFSRLVVPNHPHHITQLGVHSIDIFTDDKNRLISLQVSRRTVCGAYPVTSAIFESPSDYLWSSARYNCGIVEDDPLVQERRLPAMVDDWSRFLETTDKEQDRMIQKRTKTGRPLGGDQFVMQLEKLTGRELMLKTAGRPRIDRK